MTSHNQAQTTTSAKPPSDAPSKAILGAVLFAVATFSACSSTPKSPDVSGDIRHSLDSGGLRDVSVTQDRDKGVVTLGGHVATDTEKFQAESVAKSIAGSEVVADQIAVIPPGIESDAKAINSDLDAAIKKNLDAALIQSGFNKDVNYSVKNGVVTLTGNVNSQSNRSRVQSVASKVPNVQQVVNEVQVKDQKATTSEKY